MITARRNEKITALTQIRDHQILSGVSKAQGGNDEGPTPHELLEAALASCTIITLQMYADRKLWNLESTEVNIRIDFEGENSQLTREIKLIGDLSEEQRTRLIDIANKCPIHRLLESKIKIETVQI